MFPATYKRVYHIMTHNSHISGATKATNVNQCVLATELVDNCKKKDSQNNPVHSTRNKNMDAAAKPLPLLITTGGFGRRRAAVER
jgi:hypothetical protein